MNDWTPYPEESLELDRAGKVTGSVQVAWQGDGTVFVTTVAHINDHLQAIDFRGESFLVTTHLYRQPDGTFTPTRPDAETWVQASVTRRQNWSDAPPSFHKAIMAAIQAAVEDLWTPERDRAGLEASVAQALHSLARDRDKALTELAEIDDKITAAKARLT